MLMLYAIFVLVVALLTFALWADDPHNFLYYEFFPDELAKTTKLTYFGCIGCYILYLVVNPVWALPTTGYRFFHWLLNRW